MLDLPSPIYQLVELIKAGADPDYAPRVENISHDTLLASAHNQRLMPLLAALLHAQRVDLPPDVARRVAQEPAVAAIRGSKAFSEHHRCEPNYELDSAELAALGRAAGQPDIVRMKIGLANAIFFLRDGAALQISNSQS